MECSKGDRLSMGIVKIRHKKASVEMKINGICLFSILNTPFFAIRYYGKHILIKLSYNIINDIILIIENQEDYLN
jgi:hypothetical protein